MNRLSLIRPLAYFTFASCFALALQAKSTTDSLAVVPTPSELSEGGFISDWIYIEGVSTPKGKRRVEKSFHEEPLTSQELWDSLVGGAATINGESYKWNAVSIEGSVIDFNEYLDGSEGNIYTYAVAVIDSVEARDATFGVDFAGSIKLWLNGEFVHEHWTPGGGDEDLVSISLKQGSNQLIAKIAGATGWELSIGSLSVEEANLKFADAMEAMSIEALDKLLAQGLDINAKNSQGYTGLQIARLAGLNLRPTQLVERGAEPNLELPNSVASISSIFEGGVDLDSAGLAYLIAKDGEIISKGGLGKADIENDVPITTQTTFRIGSVTKQFTATAILLLQERGLLSVEDPLSKYIPDFPKGDEVTLRQLLNHTSGIHSYTSRPDFRKKAPTYVAPHDLVEEIKGYDYDFEPGTAWMYNNSGFFILGYLVEIVSGQPLADFWRGNLFTPLGMKNTGAYHNSVEYENEALGYSKIEGKVKLAMDWDMSRAGGAGNIYSTVEDLFLWNEAFHNGKVLSVESYRDATTPALLSNGEKADASGRHYGFGLMLSDLRGSQMIQHGGGLHGFRAMLSRLPQENITYATLSNSGPSNLKLRRDPFSQIGAMMIGLDPMEESVGSSGESSDISFEDYVGEYSHNSSILTVGQEDRQLFLQHQGSVIKNEYVHGFGDAFRHPKSSNEIVFERDESGKVTGLTHVRISGTFTQSRIEPIEAVEVDPAAFERLVGDYKLNEQLTITIRVEEGKLLAQATGQNSFQLFPLSDVEYKAKVANIRMVFNPVDDGSIESLTLHQGGGTIIAPKL